MPYLLKIEAKLGHLHSEPSHGHVARSDVGEHSATVFQIAYVVLAPPFHRDQRYGFGSVSRPRRSHFLVVRDIGGENNKVEIVDVGTGFRHGVVGCGSSEFTESGAQFNHKSRDIGQFRFERSVFLAQRRFDQHIQWHPTQWTRGTVPVGTDKHHVGVQHRGH